MIPLHDDNPTQGLPLLTIAFITVCVLVFFWQLGFGAEQQQVVYSLGATPAVLFGHAELSAELRRVPAWLTVFTSMFLHGGWMHLIGNMIYLWIFGNNIEDAMGHWRFVVFYFTCGLLALLANALPDTTSAIPMIGASGAISGVLGAYLLLYPHARVLVAIPLGFFLYTTRLPAAWVLLFWFVLQLINSALHSGGEGGGIAWLAHIGGFVAGMALTPFFKRKGVRLLAPRRRR
ncbi:MAG: rhomboid family intramembrane serine protease [Gammaproteobacteria bacterium]